MRIHVSVLATLVLLLSGPAAAQSRPDIPLTLSEYRADPFAAQRDFGRCAAFFELFAQYYQAQGMSASADEMMGTARGASATATALAMLDAQSLYQSDGEQVYANRMAYFDANFASFKENEETRLMALLEHGDVDEERAQFCFALQEVQIAVLEAVRRSGMTAPLSDE